MKKNKMAIKKLQLSDIDELSIAVFICKQTVENQLTAYVKDIGGIVLSSMRGRGLSRVGIASAFGAYTDVNVVMVMCLKDVAKDLVHDVSSKFKFNVPGNGKGFLMETDGYMGAKAAFI